MTHAAPAAMAGTAWSRACTTYDTSVEPVSSIGVPTQTTMRSRPSSGISAVGTIRPAACCVAYASGNPGSWNGIRPSRQRRQSVGVLFDQHDVVALFREAHRRRDPDVPGADDRRLATCQSP